MRIQRGVGADSCRGWHCGGGPGRRSIDFEVRASEVRVARIRDIVFSEHALAQCVYRGIDVVVTAYQTRKLRKYGGLQ